MSRWEFMRRLEELLSDISPNEREEALQYYNDYFNDAGRENEQSVIGALGSPEQVAEIVKEGLSENGSQGEFTENGFTSDAARETGKELMKSTAPKDSSKEETGSAYRDSGNGQNTAGTSGAGFGSYQGSYETYGNDEAFSQTGTGAAGKDGKGGFFSNFSNLPSWAIVLIVIGCVFLAPPLLGALGGILGGILGVIATIFGIVIGCGAAMAVCYVAAIALMIAGLGNMLAAPLRGIGLMGGGFICAAFGILFMLLTAFLAGKCLPALFRGIAWLFRSIFRKKEGGNA